MKPMFVKIARRLVTRKWYMRIRIWKMALLFKYYDSRILNADPKKLDHISEMLTRCAHKEAWYKRKINN